MACQGCGQMGGLGLVVTTMTWPATSTQYGTFKPRAVYICRGCQERCLCHPYNEGPMADVLARVFDIRKDFKKMTPEEADKLSLRVNRMLEDDVPQD